MENYFESDYNRNLKEALSEAFEYEKKGIGYVIDCAVRADELVRPMVQNGKPITDFLIN